MRRLKEPSYLDLCCLLKPIIIACGSERVNSAQDKLVIFFLFEILLKLSPYFFFFFSSKQDLTFDILCKLSPIETICMNVKTCFLGNSKTISVCRLPKSFTQIAER